MKKATNDAVAHARIISSHTLVKIFTPSWFGELGRLEKYESQLVLLPIGWGSDCKAPMIKGWPSHPGFTTEELSKVPGIRSVGALTGIRSLPLATFDIDGETALELACSRGMEPWAATTWQVHRDNDPNRLKLLFSPTPAQIAQLPEGAEFQGKTITKSVFKGPDGKVIAKGEALEVFFDCGRQVIVIGEHPSSGGNYIWPEGLGPEALTSPPEAWWQHAVEVARRTMNHRRTGGKPSASKKGTRRLDPCPICGRHSNGGNGLWCVQTTAGLILCMPGSTFNADPKGEMKMGTVINGYALVKRTAIGEGDCLTFSPHHPQKSRHRIRRPQRTTRSRANV